MLLLTSTCMYKVEHKSSINNGVAVYIGGSLQFSPFPLYSNGHLPVVKYLVENKLCDVNAKTNGGNTPLSLACS